jgi:hypothetical protein
MLDFLKGFGYIIQMILKSSDSDTNLFYTVCANWEACVEASDPGEAAAIAMERAYKEYGKEMCISPTISVMDLMNIHDTFDTVEHIHLLFTPEVLANAGLYDLSKKFKRIINKNIDDD